MEFIGYLVDGGTTALLIFLLYTERVARRQESEEFRKFSMRMIEFVAELSANRHKTQEETRNVMPPRDQNASDYFEDRK